MADQEAFILNVAKSGVELDLGREHSATGEARVQGLVIVDKDSRTCELII